MCYASVALWRVARRAGLGRQARQNKPQKEADMSNKTIAIFAAAAIATGSLLINADAAAYGNGISSSQFDVSLKIVDNCSVQTSGIDFGQTQGALLPPRSATSSLAVTCTNSTAYNVQLSSGTGKKFTIVARRLAGTIANTDAISYQLHRASGSSNWIDAQRMDTKPWVGSGSPEIWTVFGSVPPQATPTPENSITATVYF